MPEIAVYFPGIGYHCDKPLLYYSRNIARELGYTNDKTISYTYSGGNIRGNREKMNEAFESLLAQAEGQLADIAWDAYDDVLFVSKSIGTVIAASYTRQHKLSGVRHVLYTPLAQTFLFAPNHAIAFLGSADPWSDAEEMLRLAQRHQLPLTMYEGCNHSLECGDTLRNLAILRDVMERTINFCRRDPTPQG